MKYGEMKKMTIGELYETLTQRKKSLLSCRINKKLGQLSDTSSVGKSRKEIARLMMAIANLKKGNI